jgi:hypothetical protein
VASWSGHRSSHSGTSSRVPIVDRAPTEWCRSTSLCSSTLFSVSGGDGHGRLLAVACGLVESGHGSSERWRRSVTSHSSWSRRTRRHQPDDGGVVGDSDDVGAALAVGDLGSSRSPSKGAAPAYASVPRRTLTPECVGTPSGGSTDTSTMGNAATSMSAGTVYRPSARTGPRDTMPSTFGSMSHTS